MASYFPEETKKQLLSCAKDEFLKHGFAKAKVTDIAKAAELTTGAIYNHYKDKEALFSALVEDIHQKTLTLINERMVIAEESVKGGFGQNSVEQTLKQAHSLWDFIYAYFDECYLILCCSAGSKWETLPEKIIEVMTHKNMEFAKKAFDAGVATRMPTLTDIHLITAGHVTSLFGCIKYKVSKEDALTFIDSIVPYHHYGMSALLGIGGERK